MRRMTTSSSCPASPHQQQHTPGPASIQACTIVAALGGALVRAASCTQSTHSTEPSTITANRSPASTSADRRDHSTEPFPDPVAPPIRRQPAILVVLMTTPPYAAAAAAVGLDFAGAGPTASMTRARKLIPCRPSISHVAATRPCTRNG